MACHPFVNKTHEKQQQTSVAKITFIHQGRLHPTTSPIHKKCQSRPNKLHKCSHTFQQSLEQQKTTNVSNSKCGSWGLRDPKSCLSLSLSLSLSPLSLSLHQSRRARPCHMDGLRPSMSHGRSMSHGTGSARPCHMDGLCGYSFN